ncbi:MAG: radical SAM protein [Parasporobacterium sp.]|nr:radical SAM protein [Parasporobacterium sp.]
MDLKHRAERFAFKKVLDSLIDKGIKSAQAGEGLEFADELLSFVGKIQKDSWKPTTYAALQDIIHNPESKYHKFAMNLFRNVEPNILKTYILNAFYESGFRGYQLTKKMSAKYDCNIPWVVLIDPTTACNMNCKGCWAAEYGHQLSLTYDEIDDVIEQGKDFGMHAIMFTGGEPMLRKKDIIKLAEKHYDDAFNIFTNATLIDEDFCKEMVRLGNIMLSISVEGFEDANDGRRGDGHFQKVLRAMDLLKKYRIPFGCSICYTKANVDVVASDEFLDMLIEKGCIFIWYFHYMPIGAGADVNLLPTPEQRAYMKHRIREIRNLEGGKMVFAIDFQNDGQFVNGCVAGAKIYFHINAAGDIEPCAFVHYSDSNIRTDRLLDAFQKPLFKAYRAHQPFNENQLRPCPMLENPEYLRSMVKNESNAHSTDVASPEDVDVLCDRTTPYAEEWAKKADELWEEEQGYIKERAAQNDKLREEASKTGKSFY